MPKKIELHKKIKKIIEGSQCTFDWETPEGKIFIKLSSKQEKNHRAFREKISLSLEINGIFSFSKEVFFFINAEDDVEKSEKLTQELFKNNLVINVFAIREKPESKIIIDFENEIIIRNVNIGNVVLNSPVGYNEKTVFYYSKITDEFSERTLKKIKKAECVWVAPGISFNDNKVYRKRPYQLIGGKYQVSFKKNAHKRISRVIKHMIENNYNNNCEITSFALNRGFSLNDRIMSHKEYVKNMISENGETSYEFTLITLLAAGIYDKESILLLKKVLTGKQKAIQKLFPHEYEKCAIKMQEQFQGDINMGVSF